MYDLSQHLVHLDPSTRFDPVRGLRFDVEPRRTRVRVERAARRHLRLQLPLVLRATPPPCR